MIEYGILDGADQFVRAGPGAAVNPGVRDGENGIDNPRGDIGVQPVLRGLDGVFDRLRASPPIRVAGCRRRTRPTRLQPGPNSHPEGLSSGTVHAAGGWSGGSLEQHCRDPPLP